MINLLNLLSSDVDGATPGLTTQGSDGAEDFLSLLTGALGTARVDSDSDKVLPLANSVSGETDAKTPAKTSLTQWLLQQEATQLPEQTTAVATTTAGDAQALLSQLASHLKSDLQTQRPQSDSDDGTEVSEDVLASISALMAMLPGAQPPQTVTPVASDATVALNGLTHGTSAKSVLTTGVSATVQDNAPGAAHTELPAAAEGSPQLAPAALKVEAESTPTATASTAALAPVVSSTPQSTPTAVPAATVQAPLGSPDWQQNVSQHITMFTRQGQQSAELRLHPEELGQVHISLKLDDNQAQIQMVSPHSHVRAALEAALPVLRTQLAESGIQLGQSSISSESSAGQQQQHSGQQYGGRSAPVSDEDEQTLLVPASLQSAARGDGRVDIFA
jgi:Flagellar hook-length control protein